MNLKEALKKAAQAYFDNEDTFAEVGKTKEGGLKYTKKYFDDFEAELNKDKDDKDEA